MWKCEHVFYFILFLFRRQRSPHMEIKKENRGLVTLSFLWIAIPIIWNCVISHDQTNSHRRNSSLFHLYIYIYTHTHIYIYIYEYSWHIYIYSLTHSFYWLLPSKLHIPISFSLSVSLSLSCVPASKERVMEIRRNLGSSRFMILSGLIIFEVLNYSTSSWAVEERLLNLSRLEMFVDELPDMPKIRGFDVVDGVPKSKLLNIGMFKKNWVSYFTELKANFLVFLIFYYYYNELFFLSLLSSLLPCFRFSLF